MASGILDIVEGAYDTDMDGHRWLEVANERFGTRFPGVVGVGGYVISVDESGKPTFHNACLSGIDDAMTVFGPMHEDMDPALAAIVWPKGTYCRLWSEVWAEVPEGVGDASELLAFLSSQGADDILFAGSFDRMGTGVLLGAMIKRCKLPEKTREIHRRAAVHMAAGLRLRRALEKVASAIDHAEAVFEPDGRIAHAEGLAADTDMRSALREAIKRVDRARTAAVRKEEMEALGLWQGLVEGRWSLIDRHDSDGRRYYVAIANPTLGVSARQLSDAEAQVVSQAVAGEPNGVIAYSLGIAESTVAGHLTSAMRKLGVGSRMELVRLGQALSV